MAASYLKKKRAIATSAYQYELYLREMEECNIFRSGTVDSSLPPDFIENKWDKLTEKLNSCDLGPVLTKVKWKIRFKNWKNSTRQKYRTMIADQKCTGDRPSIDKFLSSFEERGLAVWGKVAMTGTPKVPCVAGFQVVLPTLPETDPLNLENDVNEYIDIKPDPADIVFELQSPSDYLQEISTPPTISKPAEVDFTRKRKLSDETIINAELRDNYESESVECKKICIGRDIHKNVEMEKIKLEKCRLMFEIAKYKFENPSFVFDDSNLTF